VTLTQNSINTARVVGELQIGCSVGVHQAGRCEAAE